MGLFLSWMMLTVVGCTSAPEAEPQQSVDELIAVEPSSMPDLDVPAHSDLTLGSPSELPADLTPFYPVNDVGAWRTYQLWTDERADPWRAVTVQAEYINAADSEQQVRPAGETVTAYSTRTWKTTADGFGVTQVIPTGGGRVQDLNPAELHVAKLAQFESAFAGTQVSVVAKVRQQVTVPAGTFDTVRVVRTWRSRGQQVTEDSWWSAHGLVAQVYTVALKDKRTSRLKMLASKGTTLTPDVIAAEVAVVRTAMGL
jgi:hypothetical protein